MFPRIGETPVCIRARAIEPAPSERRKAHPVYPLPGLRGAAAVWHHNSVGAKLECAHRGIVACLQDADHQVYACVPARESDSADHVVAEGTMFHVEPDAVKADASDHLSQPWIGNPAHAGNFHKTS